MQYIRVKNFDKFQHYKDRNPPWIKLHSCILFNADFESLPERTQLHLIKIWSLASQNDNKLPKNAAWIAGKIGAKRVDLATLLARGFVEIVQISDPQKPIKTITNDTFDASISLAQCYHPNTEVEVEVEVDNNISNEILCTTNELPLGESEIDKTHPDPVSLKTTQKGRTRNGKKHKRSWSPALWDGSYERIAKEEFGIDPREIEVEREHFTDYNDKTGRTAVNWLAAWRQWLRIGQSKGWAVSRGSKLNHADRPKGDNGSSRGFLGAMARLVDEDRNQQRTTLGGDGSLFPDTPKRNGD